MSAVLLNPLRVTHPSSHRCSLMLGAARLALGTELDSPGVHTRLNDRSQQVISAEGCLAVMSPGSVPVSIVAWVAGSWTVVKLLPVRNSQTHLEASSTRPHGSNPMPSNTMPL